MTKSAYQRMWSSIQEKNELSYFDSIYLPPQLLHTALLPVPCHIHKKIAELMGNTEKMVIEVYNHIIPEKEDAKLQWKMP